MNQGRNEIAAEQIVYAGPLISSSDTAISSSRSFTGFGPDVYEQTRHRMIQLRAAGGTVRVTLLRGGETLELTTIVRHWNNDFIIARQ